MMKITRAQLILAIVVMSFAMTPEIAQSYEYKNTCTMGAIPIFSAQRMESIFAPIAAELGTVMDCNLRYQGAVDYKDFMERLKNREYDIAFIQPFDYVRIAVIQGYVPLARRNGRLYAVIVTRPKSEIRHLSDLKGKTIALPPEVAAVTYLTNVTLANAGLNIPEDVSYLHTKNHGSCMHNVLIGKADACATAPPTLRMFEVKNRQKFRVIARSPSLPHALFVVRGNMSDESFQQLQQKLLNISLSNDARRFFLKDDLMLPFRVVDDNEYDVVREYCKKLTEFQQPEFIKPCQRPTSSGPFLTQVKQ